MKKSFALMYFFQICDRMIICKETFHNILLRSQDPGLISKFPPKLHLVRRLWLMSHTWSRDLCTNYILTKNEF